MTNKPGSGLKHLVTRFVAALCVVHMACTAAWTQGLNVLNPADRGIPWTSEFNPAVISFQDAKISLGLKVLHLGFVPDAAIGLSENRLNISLPFYLPNQIGVGLDVRYFSAGLYSEVAAALLFSREMFYHFSLGTKIGLERRSYNKDKFNVVDPDDPVLIGNLGVNSLNLGFGIYWNPGNLAFGVGVDHANRSNIGVKSRALLPQEISGAVGYKIGLLTPTLVVHADGTRTRVGFSLTAAPTQAGTFRLGYESGMPVKLEASLNLSKNNNLRYGIDLPTEGTRKASVGSHEFTYSHVFAREPDIATPDLLLSTRELRVLQETVVRSMPANLDLERLAAVAELTNDFVSPDSRAENVVTISAGALSQHEDRAGRRERFTRLAAEISKIVQQNPDLRLLLRTDARSVADARLLKYYLQRKNLVSLDKIQIVKSSASGPADLAGFEPGHFTVTRKRPQLSANTLNIRLRVPGKVRRTKKWQLKIFDSRGKLVNTFSSKGNLPEMLVWDWRDRRGHLVPPGRYAFQVRVQTKSGKIKVSDLQRVTVTQIQRTVKLKFKAEPVERTSESFRKRTSISGL
ncbi:MAG: type IX secretion system membrane protein PorP/SprF [bacterium]